MESKNVERYKRIEWTHAIKITCVFILLWSVILIIPVIPAYAVGVNPVAVAVYGQSGNFTTAVSSSGISATSLSVPDGIVSDSGGNLYVADTANNRILYYPAGSTTATRVYGQGGSFTSNTANNGGVSANSLSGPLGLALDSSGNLYATDFANSRVLYYPAGSTTATRVYGQGGSFTGNTANNGGVSANSLNSSIGIALDSSGNLYIADNANYRVLYYPAGSTTATRVYGQGGSFTSATGNNGGVSANSLNGVSGVVLDSGGNLYVGDFGNNRVLYYPAGSTTATRVYGQGGSFTSNTANNGGVSATSLSGPYSVVLDNGGNVYISDGTNHRVLYYLSGSTTATRVYGQGGSFTSNTANNGGVSANSLYRPYLIALDSGNNLYVADSKNNRALYFAAGSTTATQVYGQAGVYTTNIANTSINASTLSGPFGTAVDSSGNLYIADTANNRVLYYAAGSTTATRVYGQGGNFTLGTVNNGGISANSLYGPSGVALDSGGNLYISDSSNNRVLYYPSGSTTATRVYGQGGSFTSNSANNGGISANSLNAQIGLALDSGDNLYVADSSNNRVLYYPSGSTTATRVYGQLGSFISNIVNIAGLGNATLSSPTGVAVDSSGNVYVADYGNNRVLYFSSSSTISTKVLGQLGSFISNIVNSGGVSASSLSGPLGLGLDSQNNLYVADSGNHRALYYPAGSTSATRVYGQLGSFTSNTVNNGGVSNSSFSRPNGFAIDSSSTIYITDSSDNRALKFQTSLSISTQPPASTNVGSAFSTAASLVDVGSGSIFTDFTGTVSIAIKAGSGTAGATLSGTTSLAAVNGVATFSNLSLDKGGAGYILTASSPGVNSANTNTFAIIGSLLFTYLTSPTFSFTLTGATGTITSQHTFKVNDTTASGVGWHVTITSTQFATAGGKTLPTTATTITGVSSACTAGQICVVPTNGISGYPLTVPAAITAPAAITYFNAAGGTGTGDVTITTTFSLSIPPGTAAGTYTSTASITLVKGQ
jgi:sugar lactone lactonase YvrE